MNRVRRWIAVIGCLLTLLSSCVGGGGGQATGTALDGGGALPGADLRLFLPQIPQAGSFPFARNMSEALAFAQFYETLTELDAAGHPRPALAARWESDEGARVWTFTLRRGARFWNGRPLETADVGTAWLWTEHRAADRGLTLPAPMHPVAGRLTFPARDKLRIELTSPCPDLPRRLAAACYAVSAGGRNLHWRLGTGPCRPARLDRASAGALLCKPHAAHPRPALWASLRFESAAGGSLPDLAGEGLAGQLLEDPALEAYLRDREDLRLVDLPAKRRYGLLLTSGDDLGIARWYPTLERDLREGALRRASAAPLPAGSALAHGPANLSPFGRRVLRYAEGDATAGELARRIAALASIPAGGAGAESMLQVEATDPLALDSLTAAVARGVDPGPLLLAYWTEGAFPGDAVQARLIPIARGRSRFLLSPRMAGLELGGDGQLRLDRMGPRPRTEAAAP